MIAVLFEVRPCDGGREEYLRIAAELRAELERVDGFISVERFQSLVDPDKVLSLSFFRDEAAVRTWRSRESHRVAQARGRSGLFADYRLRIAEVIRDYGLRTRVEAPGDSVEVHG